MHDPKWCNNAFGKERTALYIGNLYVGGIMRVVPEDWRGARVKNPNMMEFYVKRESAPWRAWFMSDDEGDEIGYYATDDEARTALEDHLASAIGTK